MIDGGSGFLDLQTNTELARLLDVPTKTLTFFAYSGRDFYRTFSVPKKGGRGSRTIEAPCGKLKSIQKALVPMFENVYKPPTCVHGFVHGRSSVSNAGMHVRKRIVYKIDLTDFFPSITAARVHGLLSKAPFHFSDEVINTLTNLVCHSGHLPQGAPTSPVLSNMICYRMDKTLLEYARENSICYTRYADDLTFSSTRSYKMDGIVISEDDDGSKVSEKITAIISSSGFVVNAGKTGVYARGTRQTVTGVVVNKKCNFRRSDYRYLRTLFHKWRSTSMENAAREYVEGRPYYRARFYEDDGSLNQRKFIEHVRGLLAYYTMIVEGSGSQSTSLLKLWDSYQSLTHRLVPRSLPERSLIRIDSLIDYEQESECKIYEVEGTAFLIDGGLLCTAAHCLRPLDSKLEIKSSMISMFSDHAGSEIKSELDDWRISIMDDSAIISTADEKLSRIPTLSVNIKDLPQPGEIVVALGYAALNSKNDHKRLLRKIESKVCEILENGTMRVDERFIVGMSGGPVLNRRGEVIGIITQGSNEDYTLDGGFVPLASIKHLLKKTTAFVI